jgi:hypothetical protein
VREFRTIIRNMHFKKKSKEEQRTIAIEKKRANAHNE